jgi:CRISPR/Cas system-associated exonuclease Cas4 (RecB family)
MHSYSFTKLNDYAKCPFYFKCRNIAKLEVEEKQELTVGSVTHDILRDYTLECYKQGVTHLYENWQDIAYSTLKKHSVLPEYEEDIMGAVKSYIEANEIEIEGLAGVEERLAIDIEGTLVDWESEDTWFRAILDKLYIAGDQAKISDYKTGFSMHADKFQLEIYAWLIYKLYPQVEHIQVELDFVRFAYKKTWDISKSEFQKINRRILNRIEQVEEDTEYKPKLNSLCATCPFWKLCPAIKEIGEDNVVRAPHSKKEAVKLFASLLAYEKVSDEIKSTLKAFVEANGEVVNSDMRAYIKGITTLKYDVPKLINWANENGIDISEAIVVDNRKIKRVQGIPEEIVFPTVSTRFTISKVGEEK